MLVKRLDEYDLREEFISYNRDKFSIEGYEAIIDYFDEFEEQKSLDVMAICCDFVEDNISNIARDYDLNEDEVQDFIEQNSAYHRILDNGNIFYLVF